MKDTYLHKIKKYSILVIAIILAFQGLIFNDNETQAASADQAIKANVITTNTTWTNKTIDGDLYIGPEAVLTITGEVTVNGNIFVLGALRSYGGFNVRGTIFGKSYSWGSTGKLYHGTVQIISGSNNIRGLSASNNPLKDIPFEINTAEIIAKDGIIQQINGATLPIIDLSVEGQPVQLNDDGTFTVRQLDIGSKEAITFVTTDIFGNKINKKYNVNVIDTIPPTASTDTSGGYFGSAKTVILSMSEEGTIYYTLNGDEPTTSSTPYGGPIEIDREADLKFFAVDKAGNQSDVYTEKYAFFSVNEITDKDKEITGSAQPHSTVSININGEVFTTIANDTGDFKAEIPQLEASTNVIVSSTTTSEIESDTIETTVEDVTAPERPVVDEITDQSEQITGTAEAGAVVTVRANDEEIAETIVNEDGSFSIPINLLEAGTKLFSTATDQAGNTSEPTKQVVIDVTSPEKPEAEQVTNESAEITGTAEAGSTVSVKVGNEEIGSSTVNQNGTFQISIKAQDIGTKLLITARDLAGNVSEATEITVQDTTPPTPPKVNGVTDKFLELTGKAEPGVTVIVHDEKNKEIGRATVDTDGEFSINLDGKAQAGTELFVTVTNFSGKTSEAVEVTVSTMTEISTSRLGHITSGVSYLYTEPFNLTDKKSSDAYKNSVYYIKKQAMYNGELYYLLSTRASATKGTIGWMKASDVSSHEHKGIDRNSKTFYIKGAGSGYSHAWGGSKNFVYKDLSQIKNAAFNVNLTEKVGNNTWYRGILNGKQTWIHSSYLTNSIGNYKESSVSRLGHIRAGESHVYSSPFYTGDKKSSAPYKNSVYYIKKQAMYKGELYYLLSTRASATKGTIGWMKASDVSSHAHKGIDRNSKTFYIKGTGSGYSHAWGGSKDFVYKDLSQVKNAAFNVNLTEKVGNNTWYRGILNGKQTWIHSSHLIKLSGPYNEQNTSRLGHIKAGISYIYSAPFNPYGKKSSDSSKNSVYYIKKQATYNNELFYLLSTRASSTSGTIGWMKANELSTHPHVGVDREAKTFYVKGNGKATSTAWGGSKNDVYPNLGLYKYEKFKVHLTEKVGNNTWYRGTLDGKTVWMHSSYVVTKEESNASKLGHIRSRKVEIYKKLGDQATAVEAGIEFTNAVYYIKKQAEIADETFYLISTQPSSLSGTVGWVKENDLSTHPHIGVDREAKTFYVKGNGKATNKAWGGSKDTVYSDLTEYKNEGFVVDLTERVGNNTWYRGLLNGKTTWVHYSQLIGKLYGFEQKVVDLVNEERIKRNLIALKVDPTLNLVAQEKTYNMHTKGYFSHKSPTYGGPFNMMKGFGVSYVSAGENIARGYETPESVVKAWMNSEGHRKNILDSGYTHIGVGYLKNGHYWTQQFIKK